MPPTSHPRSTFRPLTGAALAAALFAAPLAHSAHAQGPWGWGRGNGRNGGGTYDGTDRGSDRGRDRGTYGGRSGGARTLYQWSGRVDREAYVVMQSGDVRARVDGDDGAGGRVRVQSDLPQADGLIDAQLADGRGRVDVVEQPSRRNGYRAVVRVRDDDAGAGYYRFVATWRPTGGYAGGSGDGRDRDDRDGRYGNRRDGDGRGDNGVYGGTYGGTSDGSGVLHWRGRIDDVAEIRLRGDRTDTRTVSGQGAAGVRSQVAGAPLPPRDVAVRVVDRSGRGRVSVVQQPHAWNGYTAVVRVEDHDAGAGWYDFDVTW